MDSVYRPFPVSISCKRKVLNLEKSKWICKYFCFSRSGPNKHQSAVTCLQFNSRFVITSSDDGTVKLWDVRTGDFIRNLVALDSGGSGGVVWRIRLVNNTNTTFKVLFSFAKRQVGKIFLQRRSELCDSCQRILLEF